ncbi:hypothetical protein MJO28_008908 [Puccinia striiformis f. sp. tritici]|uniref:Uncharacterized protein n=1 Tax=Puccinia striiformis f. sp. tritici TaxID=168172 RepID=A0ACC0EBY2_9BASI|nr:hypothetical protein MJO28_008908 [Puccinia striiformis f. sp. tritici]
MRSNSHSFLFILSCILQLHFTSQLFSKATRLPKGIAASGSGQRAATRSASEVTAAKEDKYWFPLPEKQDSLNKLRSYQDLVEAGSPKEKSSTLRRFFPWLKRKPTEALSGLGSTLLEVERISEGGVPRHDLTKYYSEVAIDDSALASTDPHKIFLDHMRKTQALDQYYASLIQLGFKRLWEKPGVKDEEVKQWLKVLAHTLKQQRSMDNFQMQVSASALYGLYSMQLKFSQNGALTPHIEAVMNVATESLKSVRRRIGPATSDLTWQKEILDPSTGFSDKLNEKAALLAIMQNDPEFRAAIDVDVKAGTAALEAFQQNFQSFTAHKRVAVLAAFYHVIKWNPKEATAVKLLRKIQSHAFPHEESLINFIWENTRARKTKSQIVINS